MIRSSLLAALSLVLIPVVAGAAGPTGLAAQEADPAGRWTGAIETPAGGLEIDVTLSRAEGSGWTGTIDIPAQGVSDFELSGVRVEGRRVRFAMAGVPGDPRFDGEMADGGESISGTFQQGPESLEFSLRRAEGEVDDGEVDDEEEPPTSPEDGSLPEAVPGEGVAGEWFGRLEAGGGSRLRIVLRVDSTDGGLEGRLNSVDQGANMSVDRIVHGGDSVRFSIEAANASYEGTMSPDGSAIEGNWSQMGSEFPLTFRRLAEPFSLNRPQEPRPPFPYERREVTVRNDGADLSLAGTFVVPEGEGPFPAVVFVSGSGPQDRDESLMGHRPFLVLADHLARHGVASLRYDDRGVGGSGGEHFSSTVQDFAADAEAALRFLEERPEVADDAVGVLGHSEGGLAAARLAAGDAPVDFLVLLAPPGVPLRELISRQTRDILELRGLDPELVDRTATAQAEELEMVADPSWQRDELVDTLRARARAQREELPEEARNALQASEAATEQAVRQAVSPWFRSLVREDPARHLRRVRVPVLALFGGKDIQVAPEENARAVDAALAEAGNPDYRVEILPGLNHLLQEAETGGIQEYGEIEQTIAPEVLERVRRWIAERFGRG